MLFSCKKQYKYNKCIDNVYLYWYNVIRDKETATTHKGEKKMRKTNIERFEDFRRQAEQIARNNEMNTVIYLSGSKNKRTHFMQLIGVYEENSKIDFDFAIIDKSEREIEQRAYTIMVNSVARFEIY